MEHKNGNNAKQFMNNKFVGHHVSAGGYILNVDENGKLFVVLIKSKKGEWWIPKGHIENWENELEACYREIEEEVGIKKEELIYIDFLENYKFGLPNESGIGGTKEIHIYLFESSEKSSLNVDNGGDNVKQADWMEVGIALDVIMPYCRTQLENAIAVFKKYKNI